MAVDIAPKVKKAAVTFTTQSRKDASRAILTGEWDGWTSLEMKKNIDGTFSVKINIDLGKSYQFGYSIDGSWTPDADLTSVASPFGTNNSILDLTKVAAAAKRAQNGKPAVRKKSVTRSYR